jgi:hypothetical protein
VTNLMLLNGSNLRINSLDTRTRRTRKSDLTGVPFESTEDESVDLAIRVIRCFGIAECLVSNSLLKAVWVLVGSGRVVRSATVRDRGRKLTVVSPSPCAAAALPSKPKTGSPKLEGLLRLRLFRTLAICALWECSGEHVLARFVLYTYTLTFTLRYFPRDR